MTTTPCLELGVEHLVELRVGVGATQHLGLTSAGERRVVPIIGGAFSGPDLDGIVVPGGSDWIVVRPDGVLQQDVRLTLQCHDGALILMTYRGIRHGPAVVMDRLDRGDLVDPSQYYFRMAPMFETSAESYRWLNGIVAVGVGRREPAGATYSVYRVL